MAKKGLLYEAARFFHNANQICRDVTGKPLAEVGGNIFGIFGEDINRKARKAMNELNGEVSPESPYRVLHCRPSDYDIVIKGRYRMLCRELHPDTGKNPDPAEFQRVTEAYNRIMAEREKS